MRRTPTVIIDDELILQPAHPDHLHQLVAAFEESMPEVLGGLPWYDRDGEILPQLQEYLYDVNHSGLIGRAHHWVIADRSDGTLLGLAAFDRYTRLASAHWNLGYWVRRSAQRRGIATRTADRALEWISTTQGQPTSVEITVNPENDAGMATCRKLVEKWGGVRRTEVDGEVKVAGEKRHHITFLIPRLPLQDVAVVERGSIWLSLDTDDQCHHPAVTGHPKRSRGQAEGGPYVMSERLDAAWRGMLSWRQEGGANLPLTLFVVAEQLDDERFCEFLTTLLESDDSILVACHGNRHRCWSAWDRDEIGLAHELSHAIRRLAAFAGERFRPWFRAPGGYIAPWMIPILSQQGIILDSSVNDTRLMRRKSGSREGWGGVKRALRREGVVERSWMNHLGIPMCGPALRIFGLRWIARARWRRVTADARCASEQVVVNEAFPVTTLYWHLLDHAREGGEWAPPLHSSLL